MIGLEDRCVESTVFLDMAKTNVRGGEEVRGGGVRLGGVFWTVKSINHATRDTLRQEISVLTGSGCVR